MARTQQELVVGETFADRMSLSYVALCRRRNGQYEKVELAQFGVRLGELLLTPPVPVPTIMQWFSGVIPDVRTVQAVASLCGVDPGWLAFGSASDAPPPSAPRRPQSAQTAKALKGWRR